MQTYNILLIDDEKDYCESLKTNAYQIGVDEFDLDMNVTDCQNWQDGAEHLNNNYFHALILDAKCMIDREQETENFDFLPTVISRLKEIEQKQNRHIPFAVNTGYLGEKETQMMERPISESKSKIFSKSSPKKELIVYLFKEIKKAPTTKIERDHSEVFGLFAKGYLNSTFKTHLLQIVEKADSENPTEIKRNLALIRSLQESMFQEISKIDKNVIPDKFVRPNVSFWKVHNHLSGNKSRRTDYQPSTDVLQNNWIENLSECIYKIASDNGSHNPFDGTPLPNRYTVESLVFAFLEQLLWFKILMDKNNAKS